MEKARTYRIETERLIIRCYDPKDAPLLKNSVDESLEHLSPWMPWAKFEPQTIQEKVNLIRMFRGNFDLGKDYTYGIFNKREDVLIGGTGLHNRLDGNAREIGYWINVNHINKGYATESVRALLKVGFEIENLERIEIHCTTENIRSSKVPEKIGFTHEATLKKRIENDGSPNEDKMIWTIFKDEYLESGLSEFTVNAYDITGRLI